MRTRKTTRGLREGTFMTPPPPPRTTYTYTYTYTRFQGVLMATREVYPTAAIYAVCSVFFSGCFVWMRRSPSLRLTSVWAVFVAYNVRAFAFAFLLVCFASLGLVTYIDTFYCSRVSGGRTFFARFCLAFVAQIHLCSFPLLPSPAVVYSGFMPCLLHRFAGLSEDKIVRAKADREARA